MISDIKDLGKETNDLISDLKVGFSTLQKKVDSLNVKLENIKNIFTSFCKYYNHCFMRYPFSRFFRRKT